MRTCGRLGRLLRDMFQVGAAGMTMGMYVKGLGWSEERARDYSDRLVQELSRKDLEADRIYARIRYIWARKPACS